MLLDFENYIVLNSNNNADNKEYYQCDIYFLFG